MREGHCVRCFSKGKETKPWGKTDLRLCGSCVYKINEILDFLEFYAIAIEYTSLTAAAKEDPPIPPVELVATTKEPTKR